MAEATVERPPVAFYCHECRREVLPNIPAFTCSRCDSGFIEEMADRPSLPSQPFIDPLNSDSVVQFAELLNTPFFEPLRAPVAPSWHHRYSTRLATHNDDVDVEDDEMRGVAPSAVFHFSSGDARQPGQQTIHGIINYVIQHLSNDLGGRTPLILRGNPADYAWGPNGLDAIISQLLNHLEGTGAPPAQKDKIDNLARVTIEQSHIDNTLQCSICMDDFEIATEVRKLPCDHFYHSECIVKWLEMHGTCPVCRKDLNGEDTSTNEAEFTSDFHMPSGGGNGPTSSSSSSTSMETTPSSSFSDA
uniref:RING-type E3 ubiquitin transferase n=1 Tax=Arion vulgaris TaxID=1028688 RepID=A0A0B6ZWJ8_9EUPU